MTLSLPGLEGPGAKMVGTAVISDCGLYRYSLTRTWSPGGRLAVCLVNPSKADADRPDPTLSKGVAFAKRWGFGSLEYVNLFGYRSTDVTVLSTVADPIGPENDDYIRAAAKAADLFLVAWGNKGLLRNRDREVLELVRGMGIVPRFLRATKIGAPEHLLYLPGNLQPQVYLGRPDTTAETDR